MSSTIMDRSSMSISPTRPSNSNTRTPTKAHPPSDRSTTSSMVRNMFAKNKPSPSPFNSPSRPAPYPPANTVVLTPSKRSVNGWQSPSPEPDERDDSPTPTKPKMQHTFQEVQQELKEIQASDEVVGVPAGQRVESSKSSGESNGVPAGGTVGTKREFSPTFKDPSAEEENPFLSSSTIVGASSGEVGDTPRAKKRVRMASPGFEADEERKPHIISSQPLLSTPPNLSASQLSVPSNPTDDSASTVPSNLSNTAWTFRMPPPPRSHIVNTMEENGVDSVIYTEPHYSNAVDVPPRAKMFAGRMFTLRGKGMKELEDFEGTFSWSYKGKARNKRPKSGAGQYGWEYAPMPPKFKTVVEWCEDQDAIEAEAGERLPAHEPSDC